MIFSIGTLLAGAVSAGNALAQSPGPYSVWTLQPNPVVWRQTSPSFNTQVTTIQEIQADSKGGHALVTYHNNPSCLGGTEQFLYSWSFNQDVTRIAVEPPLRPPFRSPRSARPGPNA